MKILVRYEGKIIEADTVAFGPERKAHAKMLMNHRNKPGSIDPAWKKFNRFLLDLGRRPSSAYCLRRLDATKPFGPGNCVWGAKPTDYEKTVLYEGRRVPITELAALFRIDRNLLKMRLKLGWPVDVALKRKKHGGHYNKGAGRPPGPRNSRAAPAIPVAEDRENPA